MPATKPLVLVTGDIVLDCHLYRGVRAATTSFDEPGTTFRQDPGGAALTHRLLAATAQIPGSEYAATLGLDVPGDKPLLGQLHRYGVWRDYPASKKEKDESNRTWRLDHHYGYGPYVSVPTGGFFTTRTSSPSTDVPALTVIEDDGILFRQESSRAVWPAVTDDKTHLLLRMSPPLCRGGLWEELRDSKSAMSRLLVLVSAADLRREDAEVSKRLSWEQCAESTFNALTNDPVLGELLRAAHVIVNFRAAGALWIAGGSKVSPSIRLIFDHLRLEEDFDREFEGTMNGCQSCITAGIAHHLMTAHANRNDQPGPFNEEGAMRRALESGIIAGLTTHRRMLELGHGPAKASDEPALPIEALAATVAAKPRGFVAVDVTPSALGRHDCPWSVLVESERLETPSTPLVGLAHLTARYGWDALSHVPAAKIGDLFVVDRSEIESLRALDSLIRDYEDVKVQTKPLCIGVFGPPGAGKSFGVKALAQGVLGPKMPKGEKVPILEFNLSQFKDADDLIGAFHRVRDAVLKGITPVAFWDEFDSQGYRWLQYLLAPMQDGVFQEGQVTHPIGKCIFVFAGGTSDTIDEFGVERPEELTKEERANLTGHAREDRIQKERDYLEFKRLKGPDFVSRLHGFLNVLGVNQRTNTACPDITWPIRRALMMRGQLKLKENDELHADLGLLQALLRTSHYRHGARSMEKIVLSLKGGRSDRRLYRADLPPEPVLNRETVAKEFRQLMDEDAIVKFKNFVDIDKVAAAVHNSFRSGEEKSRVLAEMSKEPDAVRWKIHPVVQRAYEELSADLKASNRAAARRVPELLLLINFVVEELTPNDSDSWVKPLTEAIEVQIDRLARAEHLGWCAERRANGWTYAETRDNERKHHNLLVDWSQLTEPDREKDRHSARSIPDWLRVAGFKAVQVKNAPSKKK